MSTDTPNIALVKSLYAAFGKGDIATIVAAVTADVDWVSTGRASDFPTLGPRRARWRGRVLPPRRQQPRFSEFSPKEFYAVGDKVFVLGSYAMTVTKTGKAMQSDWAHIFTIANGKVKAFREFLDTARAAEAYRS